MPSRRRILLWVSDSYAHGRDILRGVLRFARHREDWEIERRPGGRVVPSRPTLRRADGIVAFINSPAGVRAFSIARAPLVNVSASLPDSRWPVVANDDGAIGRMAAEHFLERGYRSFGYVGLSGSFAPALEDGFAQRLSAAKFTYYRCTHGTAAVPGDPRLSASTPQLVRWVAKLRSATAVLAVVDAPGAAVAAACRRLGRQVPDDIAILGVNNDELACESVDPPLSSIQTAGEQVGYRAAMLLADLMAGATSPTTPTWIPPLGVVARASTGALAVADPVVAQALAFIRSRAGQATRVRDVLDALIVSRKSLERKCREYLGRTPLEEIRRVHVQEVQRLLIHTDYPMAEVARRAGFARPQHMATLFHRVVGMTPTAYRQKFRYR